MNAKSKAVSKRLKPSEKHVLKRVNVSDEYCPDCGIKISRSERYETGHHHYDEHP